MSTGPEHYRQAEAIVAASADALASEHRSWQLGTSNADKYDRVVRASALAMEQAQVHATLALAAATALRVDDLQPGTGMANTTNIAKHWRKVSQ